MTLATLIVLLLKLSIIISVFAIGLKATFADALYLFRRPADLVRVLLAVNVLMPAFALVICLIFDLHPAVKLSLVVLSVSPIPPILPNKALKAGGKEAYVIGLLVAVSILSVVFIPLTIEIFRWISKVPLRVNAQVVFMTVLETVLAPLFVGIICRALSSTVADRAAKPIALIGAIVLLLCCLPLLFVSIRSFVGLLGNGTLLALVAFAVVGLVVGHLLGGPGSKNRPVLALATSCRHPAVALAIAQANFSDIKEVAAVILSYLVISVIISIPYLNWIKKAGSEPAHSEKQVQV